MYTRNMEREGERVRGSTYASMEAWYVAFLLLLPLEMREERERREERNGAEPNLPERARRRTEDGGRRTEER